MKKHYVLRKMTREARTDPESRILSGSSEKEIQSHSILARKERDEKPCAEHTDFRLIRKYSSKTDM